MRCLLPRTPGHGHTRKKKASPGRAGMRAATTGTSLPASPKQKQKLPLNIFFGRSLYPWQRTSISSPSRPTFSFPSLQEGNPSLLQADSLSNWKSYCRILHGLCGGCPHTAFGPCSAQGQARDETSPFLRSTEKQCTIKILCAFCL